MLEKPLFKTGPVAGLMVGIRWAKPFHAGRYLCLWVYMFVAELLFMSSWLTQLECIYIAAVTSLFDACVTY